MFTRAFPDQVVAPSGEGSPGWVSGPVSWAAQLLDAQPVLFNAAFATVQLAIAVGLFWPRTVKLALAGSVVWAGLVWWLGEGLGGILAGPASPLMGLPGAVILYALIALLIWPRTDANVTSVAGAGLLRRSGATVAWLLLWAWFAVESLLPANRAASAPHDMVAGMAGGEPRWIAAIDTTTASFLAHRGLQVAVVLATLFALVAISLLVPAARRAGLVLAIVLAVAIWVIGENFGEIATGTGTDPNTGLPLVLLALCYWPISVTAGRERHPSSRGSRARSVEPVR